MKFVLFIPENVSMLCNTPHQKTYPETAIEDQELHYTTVVSSQLHNPFV